MQLHVPHTTTTTTTTTSFLPQCAFLHCLFQLIRQHHNSATQGSGASRHPIAFLSIKIPPAGVDVNLDPNKNTVLLKDKDGILAVVTDLLEKFYSNKNGIVTEKQSIEANARMASTPGSCPDAGKASAGVRLHRKCHHDSAAVSDNKRAHNSCTDPELGAVAGNSSGNSPMINGEVCSNNVADKENIHVEVTQVVQDLVADRNDLHLIPDNCANLQTESTQKDKFNIAEQGFRNKAIYEAPCGKDSHSGSDQTDLNSAESCTDAILDSNISRGVNQLSTSDENPNQENWIILTSSGNALGRNKAVVQLTGDSIDCEQLTDDEHDSRVVKGPALEPINDANHLLDLLVDDEFDLLPGSSSYEKESEGSTNREESGSSSVSKDRASDPENLLNDTDVEFLLCEAVTSSKNLTDGKEISKEINTCNESVAISRASSQPLSEKDWSTGQGLVDKQGNPVEVSQVLNSTFMFFLRKS